MDVFEPYQQILGDGNGPAPLLSGSAFAPSFGTAILASGLSNIACAIARLDTGQPVQVLGSASSNDSFPFT